MRRNSNEPTKEIEKETNKSSESLLKGYELNKSGSKWGFTADLSEQITD
jgi:hypothetical protein